jgi:hypothetical protein
MLSEWEKWKQSLGETRPWHLLDEAAKITNKLKIEERMSICRACPEFISLTTQCKQCGCIMKAKTTLKNAECPIGKWGKEENAQ